MHVRSETSILYFGTPVVLISSLNEDGSYNLAPMSSAFWLGWRCVLGLSSLSKTTQNLQRTRECVLNLPSVNQVKSVNQLARKTGANPVPETKVRRGYEFEADKFGISGLTPIPSEIVGAPRVLECPVHLESQVEAIQRAKEPLRLPMRPSEARVSRTTSFALKAPKSARGCPSAHLMQA